MWGSITDLGDVIALARDGVLEPTVTTFGFDQIPDALRRARGRRARRAP